MHINHKSYATYQSNTAYIKVCLNLQKNKKNLIIN